jgi:hypothetical protein
MKTVYLVVKVGKWGDVQDVVSVFETRNQAKAERDRRNSARATYEYLVVGRPFKANV